MKKIIVPVFLVVVALYTNGQNKDSLYRAYQAATHDTSKVNTLLLLSVAEKNYDSSLLYAQEALMLSKKAKFEKGEAGSYGQIGNIFFETDNYPKALEYCFKSQEIYEHTGDLEELRKIVIRIRRIYSFLGNHKTALSYYEKAKVLITRTGQDERLVYFPIGSMYDNMDKNDSALSYYQRAYEYISTKGNKASLASVLSHLGTLHLKMKHYDLALTYGRMSVAAYEQYTSHLATSTYRHLADIFLELGHRDSAFYYAQKAYNTGVRLNSRHLQMEGASLLAKLYQDDKSALKYYKIATELKDSLYSNKKSAEIQHLSFNERQRQIEMEAQDRQESLVRSQNLQYAAIAVGLLVFVIGYLLLSHSIIAKEKLVRFFGILSLLVVFEFINLLIHPYLADITHHSPLWMLLIMVAIAALLIPVHHRLEKWVIQRLVEKNKRIRLAAAKKTVAKLEGTDTYFTQEKREEPV